MDLTSIFSATPTEIIAGIVTGILGFFFGHKHGSNREKKKNLTATNSGNFKDIKTL